MSKSKTYRLDYIVGVIDCLPEYGGGEMEVDLLDTALNRKSVKRIVKTYHTIFDYNGKVVYRSPGAPAKLDEIQSQESKIKAVEAILERSLAMVRDALLAGVDREWASLEETLHEAIRTIRK